MKKLLLQLLTIPIILLFLFAFDFPADWFKAGSHPESYEMGIEKASGPDGKNAATIKSVNKKINGFGTLMQTCLPGKYAGKRVRMSGSLKSNGVKGWAGFWLRVDKTESSEPLAFDNMQEQHIKGTTDWKKHEIVLDVPPEADKLAYGALLSGTGQIWFTNIKFEIVDTTVPVTDMIKKQKPVLPEPSNLDFEK